MCDQTMPYTPGTIVWVKLGELKSVWWPGRVVDISNTPEETQAYANKKKNYKAIIYFESDNYYEVVFNMDKVCLYSSKKKMEFLEKGYSKFLKQKKTKILTGCDMSNFLSDIIKIEKEIGGDIHIFKQFEKESEVIHPPVNIKELFVSTKDLKKRKKEDIKRSTFKPLVSKQDKHKISNTRPVSNTQVCRDNYICQLKKGCKFSTNKYDILKRHMAVHKNEDNNETVTNSSDTRKLILSKFPSSSKAYSPPTKKRKYNKKITNNQKQKPDKKKIKLQDELLKDWIDGDEQDEIEFQDASKSQSESIFSKNTEKSAEVSQNTYSRNDYCDTSEDSVDEDFIKTYSNDKERLKSVIFDDTQTSSKIIQVRDECEIPEDMFNSCSLITETDNTLNQISNLEESMKVSSCTLTKADENIGIDKSCNSLNESDSNILVKDKHISVIDNPNDSETNLCTKDDENTSVDNISSNSLNKSTCPSKDMKNQVDLDNLVESTISKESSVESGKIIGKEPIIDANINTNLIPSNVNSNGLGTPVLNLNSNTDDSSHLSDVNMTESDCYEGDMISKLPTPDWAKKESWATDAEDLLKKAKLFMTLRKPKRLGLLLPVFQNNPPPFTPVFSNTFQTPPIFSEILPNEAFLKPGDVRVQLHVDPEVRLDGVSNEVLTDEELFKHPVFIRAMEAIKSGNSENVFLELHGVNKDDICKIKKIKANMESSYNYTQC